MSERDGLGDVTTSGEKKAEGIQFHILNYRDWYLMVWCKTRRPPKKTYKEEEDNKEESKGVYI